MENRKVFVINKSTHDYSKAEEFGDLVFITENAMNRFSTSKMYRTFKPFIEASQIGDCILVSGLTVMNIVFCIMFARLHGRVNLLIYKPDRRDPGRYVLREIVL